MATESNGLRLIQVEYPPSRSTKPWPLGLRSWGGCLPRALYRSGLQGELTAPEQGDGMAFIFGRDPSGFTLPLHGKKNFPVCKQASPCDIGFDSVNSYQIRTDDAYEKQGKLYA